MQAVDSIVLGRDGTMFLEVQSVPRLLARREPVSDQPWRVFANLFKGFIVANWRGTTIRERRAKLPDLVLHKLPQVRPWAAGAVHDEAFEALSLRFCPGWWRRFDKHSGLILGLRRVFIICYL